MTEFTSVMFVQVPSKPCALGFVFRKKIHAVVKRRTPCCDGKCSGLGVSKGPWVTIQNPWVRMPGVRTPRSADRIHTGVLCGRRGTVNCHNVVDFDFGPEV